jgi:hypothetical protein
MVLPSIDNSTIPHASAGIRRNKKRNWWMQQTKDWWSRRMQKKLVFDGRSESSCATFTRRFFKTLRNFYTKVEARISISLYFMLVTMARDLHEPLPLWDSLDLSTMRFSSLKRTNRAHLVRPVFS